MNDRQKILDRITNDDIINIMEELGSDRYREVSDGILFRTICHNGEYNGKLKLHYHNNSKTFNCYTSCGYIGDIFSLVMHMKEWKYYKAFEFVCRFLNITISHSMISKGFKEVSDNKFINKFLPKSDRMTTEKLEPKNEDILSSFYNLYYEGWVKDHISIETMKIFNIKFNILDGCIVIPHYSISNDLVGVRGRFLKESMLNDGKKYMPLVINGELYNYPTSLNLFGLNINANNIFKYKKILIGESEKFVMQHYTYYPNDSIAVGLNGSALSDEQINIIKSLGVETVILALDKEYETIEQEQQYAFKIRKSIINKLYPFFNIEIIWDRDGLIGFKDSPTDHGKETFEKLYKKRIKYINEPNVN